MSKTNKILTGLLLVLLACAVVTQLFNFIRQQSEYPAAWDEIHLGMTREDVYNRISLPTSSGLDDIKGVEWVNDKLTQNHVLWVSFENDKVRFLQIKRFIGTKEHFSAQVIRSEPSS